MLKVASKFKETNGLTETDLVKQGFKKISKTAEKDFVYRFGLEEGTTDIYAHWNEYDYDMAYGVKKGDKDLTFVL